MITPRNILRHELTGLDVSVIEASNPLHRGITGRIIDESRNTLLVRTLCGDRVIPKLHSRFGVLLPDGTRVIIDGSALVATPERRISQFIKNRG